MAILAATPTTLVAILLLLSTAAQAQPSMSLSWKAANVQQVQLNGKPVPVDGTHTANLAPGTHDFLLRVTVSPAAAPVIAVAVSPSEIEDSHDGSHRVTLTWNVTGATAVTLDGNAVPASGTQPILAPALGTHTYTIAAIGTGGSLIKTATLTVKPHSHLPHPDDLAKQAEHLAMLALVPRDQATHKAVTNGDSNSAATWGGSVPTATSKVLIPAGMAVTATEAFAGQWLRVDGTLKVSTVTDTSLTFDTIICDAGSLLDISPQGKKVTVTFTDTGPIDPTKDPLLLSRGLIAHGAVDIHGQYVAPDHAFARLWVKGAVPVLDRSIVFQSAATEVSRRAHVMFMHSGQVVLEGTRFSRIGRTDKSRVVTDPVAGSPASLLNPRGRYAVHFHRAGGGKNSPPAICRGVAVDDSPGLGIVNHSSHVLIEDNTIFNVHGSGIYTEVGDELGAIRGNVVLNCPGTHSGFSIDGSDGDRGHGVWIRGGGTVEVSDNTVGGAGHSGIVYMGNGASNFKVANLPDPSIVSGRETIPSHDVPLRDFRNYCHSSPIGMTIWAIHNPGGTHSTRSRIEDLTVTKCASGISLGYSPQHHFKRLRLIGDINKPVGNAISNTGSSINGIIYEDLHVEGWQVGLPNPCTESGDVPTEIRGGYFNNVVSIYILNTQQGWRRTLLLDGKQTYGTLPAAALVNNRWPYQSNWTLYPVQPQWDIYCGIHVFNWHIGSLEGWPYAGVMPELGPTGWRQLFASPNKVVAFQDVIKVGDEFLSFDEFGPTYSLATLKKLPDDLRLKDDGTPRTTAELAADKGLFMGARVLPPDARKVPRSRGWLHKTPAEFK